MALTLEMPLEEYPSASPSHQPAAPIENPVADEAAAMVEEGGGEDGYPVDIQPVAETEVVYPADIQPATAEPAAEVPPGPGEDYKILMSVVNRTPEFAARVDFERTLHEAESAYVEFSLIRSKIQDDLKAAKEVEKEALERIQDLNARGWQSFVRKDNKQEISQGGGDPSLSEKTSDEPALADSPPLHRDWRTVSIDELGLKGKFIDKLKFVDAGTMGELEDLRAAIVAGSRSWPEGVGPKKIEAITNAHIEWMAKNAYGMDAVDATEPKPQVERALTEPEPPVDELAQLSQRISDIEWEFPKDGNGPKPLTATGPKFQGHFEDGANAARNGQPWKDCTWTMGMEQDSWLRGWLKGKREEQSVPAAEPAAAAEKAAGFEDVNLEDL